MSSGGEDIWANDCEEGWGPHAKNWTFAKQALEVMCGDLNMTGVLLITKESWDGPACSIPSSCKGKVLQTPFVSQDKVFNYFRESRFLFVPQVYDASPRVIAEAMTLNVPVLMNYNIVGGWKYINKQTVRFFHDMTDLKESAQSIMQNLDKYEPREYILENYGKERAGKKLRTFVMDNFSHRVELPEGKLLIPS